MNSNDEATQNSDADNPPRPNGAPGARTSDGLEITPGETKLVGQWHKDVATVRLFDEGIRKLYARDRKYARGDSSGLVQHSLIQAYIDILVAFLVARDPDFDCPPAERVGETEVQDAEDYGKTMEIVVRHLLKSAKIKRVAERMVRSALSVGIGWVKAVWRETYDNDPHVKGLLTSAQDNLARVRAQERKIAEGDYQDEELEIAKLQAEISGLQARMETMISHGMSLALIQPEDMLVSIDVESILDSETAAWQGHRYFIHYDEACAEFPRVPMDRLKAASTYSPRKPASREDSKVPGAIHDSNAEDADAFVKGSGGGADTQKFLCAYEIWDGRTNKFFTLLEGINDRYAIEPQDPPAPSERFYPFFSLSFTEVDGERHPQSLIARSYKMQDEIDRVLNAFVSHRRAVVPFLAFDAESMTPANAKKLKDAVAGERVPVKLIGAPKDRDLRKILVPVQYNSIDMALYDIAPYIRCMETIWGIQEALTGNVTVAKTATEAEIQQAGTQAKSGHKRDTIERFLGDLGKYTAEVSANRLSVEQVQQIAGASSYWIQITNPEELSLMLTIDVRAGSSGKPDTEARREAWGLLLDQIKQMVEMIATFRQTPPDQVADCLEALLLETGERFGERIDMKQFIPQAPAMPMVDPVSGQPMTTPQAQQASAAVQGAVTAPPGEAPPQGQEAMAPVATPQAITGGVG